MVAAKEGSKQAHHWGRSRSSRAKHDAGSEFRAGEPGGLGVRLPSPAGPTQSPPPAHPAQCLLRDRLSASPAAKKTRGVAPSRLQTLRKKAQGYVLRPTKLPNTGGEGARSPKAQLLGIEIRSNY